MNLITDFKYLISENNYLFLQEKVKFLKAEIAEMSDSARNTIEEAEKSLFLEPLSKIKSELQKLEFLLNIKTSYKPTEQKDVCLPGNGILIQIDNKEKTFYYDTEMLSGNTLSIFSYCGKEIFKKEKGTEFVFKPDPKKDNTKSGKIIDIFFPSEATKMFFTKV